jgi:hypothetical protein
LFYVKKIQVTVDLPFTIVVVSDETRDGDEMWGPLNYF